MLFIVIVLLCFAQVSGAFQFMSHTETKEILETVSTIVVTDPAKLADLATGTKAVMEKIPIDGESPKIIFNPVTSWMAGAYDKAASVVKTTVHGYCAVFAPLSPVPVDDVVCVSVHVFVFGAGLNTYSYYARRRGATLFADSGIGPQNVTLSQVILTQQLSNHGLDIMCIANILNYLESPPYRHSTSKQGQFTIFTTGEEQVTEKTFFRPCEGPEGKHAMSVFYAPDKTVTYKILADNSNIPLTLW